MRSPYLSRTTEYRTTLVGFSRRGSRSTRHLVAVLTSSLFLLGFLLPCFAIEQSGSPTHTQLHSASHEHHHSETPASSPESSHSHKHGKQLCCHDGFRAALYRATETGKIALSRSDSPKHRSRLFYFSSPASSLTIVFATRYECLGARALCLFALTPTLYALHTSLLL